MDELHRNTYIRTATVADLLRWLWDDGKLNVTSIREAQRLGERYFDEGVSGPAPDDWRQTAYVSLFDWAGT